MILILTFLVKPIISLYYEDQFEHNMSRSDDIFGVSHKVTREKSQRI